MNPYSDLTRDKFIYSQPQSQQSLLVSWVFQWSLFIINLCSKRSPELSAIYKAVSKYYKRLLLYQFTLYRYSSLNHQLSDHSVIWVTLLLKYLSESMNSNTSKHLIPWLKYWVMDSPIVSVFLVFLFFDP